MTRIRVHQLWSALLGPGGIALLVAGSVLGFGSRHLLTKGLPAIGRFQKLPEDPLDLFRSWWHGWRSTGTGIDLGSYVSRRPMAWIVVPVASFYSFKNNFFATKHHKHLDTKQKLTLSEIFEMGLAYYGSKIESNNEIILEQLTML